jgi:hypothetical protein
MPTADGRSTPLCDARQVARHYKVTYGTVLEWYRRGWIPGRRLIGKPGRQVQFDLAAVGIALRNRESQLNPAMQS